MSNFILPFAQGGGASVLTDAAYLAISDRTNGNQPGVASAQLNNKALRQLAAMSAGLAQFLADRQASDIVDTLTPAQVSALLGTALPSPVVGMSRNLSALIAAAGASVTFAADELVVKAALGGAAFSLVAFSKTLNVGTVGAGGMDTGAAPATAWVAIYAIYNPTTGASALLGRATATAVVAAEVYGGANMPAGYTHSALLMVWPTTAGNLLLAGACRDRRFSTGQVNVLSTSTTGGPFVQTASALVPANAKRMRGYAGYQSTVSTSAIGFALGGTTTLFDIISGQAVGQASLSFDIQLPTPQTYYWQGSNGSGTFGANVFASGYEI